MSKMNGSLQVTRVCENGVAPRATGRWHITHAVEVDWMTAIASKETQPIRSRLSLTARGAMGLISARPCVSFDRAVGGGSGWRSQFQRAFQRKLAGNPQEKARNETCGSVFQLPWRSSAQQLAQDQAQVKRADVDQHPLQYVLAPANVSAPQTAGLVAVGKAALDQFAAPSE